MAGYKICQGVADNLLSSKNYGARILIQSPWFLPVGYDIKEISCKSEDRHSGLQKSLRTRVLIETTRFPPFGFDIKEISSKPNDRQSSLQNSLSHTDADRDYLVSRLRVRYNGYEL